MKAEFLGLRVNVLNRTLNGYTFNYTLELPQLIQTGFGKDLTVTATGNNGTLTKKSKIFLRNCKCDHYISLFFSSCFSLHFLIFSKFFFFFGKLSYLKSIIWYILSRKSAFISNFF